MKKWLITPAPFWLWVEFCTLFLGLPMLICWHPTRVNVHLCLWLVTGYAAYILHHLPGFSWREAWRGQDLSRRDWGLIGVRFVVSTAGVVLLTLLLVPDRLLSFPAQRPVFWGLIMLLYPLLSALPQELVFRSFFFRRYETLFGTQGMSLAISAFIFGFIHIVFHNPVSPLLSLGCGFFLAGSYQAHRSLKKAAIEHALYGNMVFTIGLGLYFLVSPV